MKALIFALTLTLLSSGAQAMIRPESETAAMATAKAIMEINMGAGVGHVDLTVLRTSSESDDANITETFVIRAQAMNKEGEPYSSEFFYTIKLVNGSVWTVKTRCPACG